MERIEHSSGCVFYRSQLLSGLGVRHAFSTRIGGVSGREFASLNLGNPAGCPSPDSEANISENMRRLCAAAGLSESRVSVRQVHGATVFDARRGDGAGIEADAILSQDSKRTVVIRTADCAAVLIASANGRTICAVHAGWRGVVADVVGAGVRAMRQAGAEPAAAAVFPCISEENFEVGLEVVEAFKAVLGEDGLARSVGGRQGEHGGKGRADVAGRAGCSWRRRV